jgi:hypothetical protein
LKLLLGDDLLEFHQAVVSTLRDADDVPIPLDPAPHIPHHTMHSTHASMLPPMNDDLGRISDTVNTDQDPEDDMDPGRDERNEDVWWRNCCDIISPSCIHKKLMFKKNIHHRNAWKTGKKCFMSQNVSESENNLSMFS